MLGQQHQYNLDFDALLLVIDPAMDQRNQNIPWGYRWPNHTCTWCSAVLYLLLVLAPLLGTKPVPVLDCGTVSLDRNLPMNHRPTRYPGHQLTTRLWCNPLLHQIGLVAELRQR